MRICPLTDVKIYTLIFLSPPDWHRSQVRQDSNLQLWTGSYHRPSVGDQCPPVVGVSVGGRRPGRYDPASAA